MRIALLCPSSASADGVPSVRADLDNMKGSTVDAMSAAIDNAAVMVFCISLAYKESSSGHNGFIPGHSPASV